MKVTLFGALEKSFPPKHLRGYDDYHVPQIEYDHLEAKFMDDFIRWEKEWELKNRFRSDK